MGLFLNARTHMYVSYGHYTQRCPFSRSSQVKPRRTLFIAADGPGPAAKMLLQRKRRAKTSGAGKAAKENDNSRSSGSAGINGAVLTPGTVSKKIKFRQARNIEETVDTDEGYPDRLSPDRTSDNVAPHS